MKISKSLLIATLLAGCTSGFITPKAYEMAAAWCSSHDGIRWAKATNVSREYWELEVVCRDGVEMAQRLQGKP
jgi:hypothetical protein